MPDPPTGNNASATPVVSPNGGGTSDGAPSVALQSIGEVSLKNSLDVPDDSLVYDRLYTSPMRFITEVTQARSTPNGLRTRQRFYGRFITRLFDPSEGGAGGPQGDIMWDPILAALKISNPGALSEMKLFVGVVHISELQSDPFPKEDDWDSINKIATNGGVFKSFVYTGEDPKYGDDVLVSFADLSTRKEGIFLWPLAGGQAAGGAAAGAAAGGATTPTRTGPAGLYGSCRERPKNRARRPSSSSSTSTPTPSADTQAANAVAEATSMFGAPPATPAAADSWIPAPVRPTNAATSNNTPSPANPDAPKPLARCDAYGKPIHWKRSGQKNEDLLQLGPNRIFGTDVSKWNAARYLKWDKLKNVEGCEYVIIKLSEGLSGANGSARDQYNGAKGVGMLVGPYHFCRSERQGDPIRNAKREFDVFRAKWKALGAWDITPSLDFESGRSTRRGFRNPAGNLHNLKFYLEFCRLIKEDTGNYPMLYTAGFARAAFMNGARTFPEYGQLGRKCWLWWAEYDRTRDRTKSDAVGGRKSRTWNPWGGYDIWQFSGWGRFESLDGQGRFDFNSMKRTSLPKIKWGASATPPGFSGAMA